MCKVRCGVWGCLRRDLGPPGLRRSVSHSHVKLGGGGHLDFWKCQCGYTAYSCFQFVLRTSVTSDVTRDQAGATESRVKVLIRTTSQGLYLAPGQFWRKTQTLCLFLPFLSSHLLFLLPPPCLVLEVSRSLVIASNTPVPQGQGAKARYCHGPPRYIHHSSLIVKRVSQVPNRVEVFVAAPFIFLHLCSPRTSHPSGTTLVKGALRFGYLDSWSSPHLSYLIYVHYRSLVDFRGKASLYAFLVYGTSSIP